MKNKNTKRCSYIRKSNFPQVQEALIKWIKQMRDNKVSLSGPVIKEKALIFARLLGIENFKASDGYIAGLKKRYLIEFRNEHGESFSVDQNVVEKWKSKLSDLIKDKQAKDIYNIDETGLFWKLLPTKTFAFQSESRHGIKQIKDRITVVLITNADGSDRLAIVIRKSKKPRCFNKVKKLPIEYHSQSNAWINNDIFKLILQNLNRKMKIEKRKVILFLDNCSSHYIDMELSNIKLEYFPSNTTSQLQPLDLGIIKNFKSHYRKFLVSQLIARFENGDTNFIKQFDLVDAMSLISSALKKISSLTIQKCFS